MTRTDRRAPMTRADWDRLYATQRPPCPAMADDEGATLCTYRAAHGGLHSFDDPCGDCGHHLDAHDMRAFDGCAGCSDCVCVDCGRPMVAHLSADECEAIGIDAGLRDGLGCVIRAADGRIERAS